MSGTAEREREVLASVPTGLFINGQWCDSCASERIDVEDPATGSVLTSVSDAGALEAGWALDAAAAAGPRWSATSARERAEVLRRAYDLIVERAQDLALLITMEMGKPLAEARAEVAYGADYLLWFSEEAPRIAGRYGQAPAGGSRLVTTKQPVGPCLMITPWNFPLAMATRKVAPAVAAGATMVVKPAAQTPLSMLAFAAIMEQAGLPAGVLNVVTTSRPQGLVAPLLRDPRLRKLTFTGSTPVGRRLVEQSSQQLLRMSMELGGNAPFLVFGDADLDLAVDGAMAAKMRNAGQACTAANRFYVHRSVVEEFCERFAERIDAMTVGRGTEDGVSVGPLVDEGARTGVSARVKQAVSVGARVVVGGESMTRSGYFYAPTLVRDVQPGSRLLTEETFGPVAPVVVFDDEAEAVSLANSSEHGLVGYLFTEGLDRGLRVAEAMETGMVGVNTGAISDAAAPFGGVKASGFGREGGAEGIEEYLETKYVRIASR